MKRTKLALGHLIIVTMIGVGVMSCSKKSSNNASTPAPTTLGGYVTCPATGFYSNNGINTQCTPGTTVYIGTSATSGTTTCPATGYYMNNGVTYTCTPGSMVYIGGGTALGGTTSLPTTTGNPCAQVSAQYGIPYVFTYYMGQPMCVRYDLVGRI